jgi:DNA replication and repair protein RecF
MYIHSLTLRQFRNYADHTFAFRPGLNSIVGDNATGKTNILESVFFLSTLHSYRTHNLRELIRHGDQGMAVAGAYEGATAYAVNIKLFATGRKEIMVNGVKQNKASDLFGKIPVMWFCPEDLRLVKGEPEVRRRWMNFLLTQVNPGYYEGLKRYHKIIIERNAALRRIQEGREPDTELDVWDEELAAAGVGLIERRAALIDHISPLAHDIHQRLSSERETMAITYQPACDTRHADNPARYFIEKLAERRPAELAVGSTLVGPHRDELIFTLNNEHLRAFGSQGQQRSVVLSLKLAEIAYIKQALGEYPIGLFDDVLSELDDQRSAKFWDILTHDHHTNSSGSAPGMQCLLTSVNLPAYVHELNKPFWITVPAATTPVSPAMRNRTTISE